MSKPKGPLTKLKGFTPLIDVVVQELGLVPAAVYGFVWRMCQGADEVCWASLDTIAKSAGVNRRTVIRHVKRLCELGYLEDLTPDQKHRTHEYTVTDKVEALVEIKFGLAGGVTESHSSSPRGDRESLGGDRESLYERIYKKKDGDDDNDNPHAETLAHILRTYSEEVGAVTPGVKSKLADLVAQYPDVRRWGIAFDGVVKSGVRRLDYLTTCLENVGKVKVSKPR